MQNSGFMPYCETCSKPREAADAVDIDVFGGVELHSADEQANEKKQMPAMLTNSRKRGRPVDERATKMASAASKRPRRVQGGSDSV